jgi:peptidoglycan/LPS O-acetylase OafA/YrhL
MRRIAYGLMALGVLVAAVGMIVLTWRNNLHQPFSHNEGISIALFLLGGGITYLGMLVRRRDNLVKNRERAA